MTKTFTNDDDDDDIEKVEVDFLHQKAVSSNPRDWTWCERPVKDDDILESQYIFYGPVLPEIKKGVFTFPDVEANDCLLRLKKEGLC